MSGICDGRVVLVTGAGRGIGRAHALAFARAGARVVVNDLGVSLQGEDGTGGPAEEVVAAIRELGGEAIANGADVADFAQVGDMVKAAVETFGGLDVIVNNAGFVRDRMFVSTSEEEWDAIVRVHLKGHYCVASQGIRTRGTIGGSLAHADPAADWVSCLAALDAQVIVFGPSGRRSVPVSKFMLGVFETALSSDEILESVRIPKLDPTTRWGYYKICRKTGEFAHALAAVLHDPERGRWRAVVGATDSVPIVLDDAAALFDGDLTPPLHKRFDRAAAARLLEGAGLNGDDHGLQLHVVTLERAIRQLQ